MLRAVLLLLALQCARAVAAPVQLQASLRQPEDTCRWHDVDEEAGISSWEFQLRIDPERNATLPRAEWEADVERSFEAVERRLPALRLDRSSRRTMIWHEVERSITTDDGQPLDPEAAAAGVAYPFREVGVLRLRLCLAVVAPTGVRHPKHLLRPGEADLTLKLKGVDPGAPPTWDQGLPEQVEGAQLQRKLENDVHCDYQRASWSALYHRALGLAPAVLHRLQDVRHYFPSLPEQLRLDPAFPLPARLNHFQSKTYWNVTLDGVHGTVQLYANSPDRASALAGSASYPWELSLRLSRKGAGERLHSILELIADAADELGRVGWDVAPGGTWVQRS
ncbi:hypothetical protein C2E21_1458 [Chlorella sorokiniana]|uniref:Uncharacterized protein n=1 Tax=Chlorella sorokiniana TaxID=3076 RepID=A0A2P6U0Q7_CHLSO|nr:hypothetical protein C2E21_1458 [Chlorella sorokiniana]|eukprot:PRW59880.1 hypothetical protein C2E21_1458 [Chlorella sorokiniana]